MSRQRKENRDRPPEFTTCHIVRLIAGGRRLDIQAPGVPIELVHAMLKVDEKLQAAGSNACGKLDAPCQTPQQPTP
jgi:hypothetical protein